jgi:hypothetical protein
MKAPRQPGPGAAALAALAKSQALAAAGTALFRNQLGDGWAAKSIALANAASAQRIDAPDHATVLILHA